MSISECYSSLARMLDYPGGKEGMAADCDVASRGLQCQGIDREFPVAVVGLASGVAQVSAGENHLGFQADVVLASGRFS